MVELLLQKDGIDVNLQDNDNRTPLLWAASKGHKDVVELLVQKDGIDVDHQDKDGLTVLSWAARNGHLEVTELLLHKDGIEVNAQDMAGWTPLIWATRTACNWEMVKLLLRKGDNAFTGRLLKNLQYHDVFRAYGLLQYDCGG